MKRSFYALILSLSLLAQSAYAQLVQAPVLIGYYVLEPKQIKLNISAHTAQKLSHINIAFLDLDEQGRCSLPTSIHAPDAHKIFAQIQQLKRHQPRLRILFSLGGWLASNDDSPTVARYRVAAASEQGRQKLAQTCLALVRQFEFDGLDIDWEYPRAEDAENFVLLLQEIRQQMQAVPSPRPLQLTMAAAGGAFNLARTYAQWPRIAESLDYLNLMTYDLNGAWEKKTKHHAHLFAEVGEDLFNNPLREVGSAKNFPSPFALTVDAAVQQFLQAGVPAHKLVLGVPFYGRAFFDVAQGNAGLHRSFITPAGDDYHGDVAKLYACAACAQRGDPRVPHYADIQALLKKNVGYQRHFSSASKAVWLFHPQKRIFVSYEDAQSLRYKLAYVREQKLAGVMFWHLGQDDAQGSLLTSLERNLRSDARLPSLGQTGRYLEERIPKP